MLKYFGEVKCNNQIYSCDMLRISFYSKPWEAEELSHYINSACAYRAEVEVYPCDTRFAHYKNLVVFRYSDDAVVKCGFGFNGANKEDSRKGFIEFNPNKVADITQFQNDYGSLRKYFSNYEVSRVDIALDLLGASRDKVFLCKDNRVYELKAYSIAHRTEYLGQRNSVGRVKVYNKSLECKLAYPMTRIEITTEPTVSAFNKYFPKVYDFGIPIQQNLFSTLGKTDIALLQLLYTAISEGKDNGLMIFKTLGKDKRKKLESFLLADESLIKCNLECVRQVFDNIREKFALRF